MLGRGPFIAGVLLKGGLPSNDVIFRRGGLEVKKKS